MDPDHADHRLLRNLHMLRTLVEATLEEGDLRAAVGGGLTFPQLNVLKLVLAGDPAGTGWPVRRIATHLRVSLPAASKAVDRLRRGGWLQVDPDEEDRRRLRVRVTRRGREAVRRYEARKVARLRAVLAQASDAAVARWSGVLEELIGVLLGEAGEDVPCLRCGTYAERGCVVELHGAHCPVRGALKA